MWRPNDAFGSVSIRSYIPDPTLTPISSGATRLRGRRLAKQRDQSLQQLDRSRRTSLDVQIDRDHGLDRADGGIGIREDAAAAGTIADRDHPFGRGRCGEGAFERDLHVL